MSKEDLCLKPASHQVILAKKTAVVKITLSIYPSSLKNKFHKYIISTNTKVFINLLWGTMEQSAAVIATQRIKLIKD